MRTRRLCTSKHHQGPRWLLHTEFHVKVWGDAEKTWPAQLQPWCKACTRITARIRVGVKRRGRPFKPQGKRMTPGERKQQKRDYYYRLKEEAAKGNPKRLERKRQTDREAAAVSRRKQGIPPRNFAKARDSSLSYLVDVSPLIQLLTEMGLPIPEELNHGQKQITIDTADRILIGVGHHYLLNQIYPPGGVS